MLTVGLALFLYTAVANVAPPIALTHPPSVVAQAANVASPDHAPPHPLEPRIPPPERPPDSVLRFVLQVAKAALASHGH